MIAASAWGRQPEFRAQHWLVGSVTGAIPGGRDAIVSARLLRAPETIINTTAVGGNFRFNLFNINLSPTDPASYQTWAPGDVVEIYIDPILNGDFQSTSTIRHTTASPGSPGVEEVGTLTVTDAIATYGGPQLTVKVLMEGYYNGTAQVPALVKVEARTGSGGPETATPARLVETTFIRLNETGTGHNGFPSGTIPRNDYYFVISHVPATTELPAIHLPVITGTARNFGQEGATNYNRTIDVSDSTAADHVAAYTPPGATFQAMKDAETATTKLLRTGDANGDGFIGIEDFSRWERIYNARGFSVLTDFTGNAYSNIEDFSFWNGEYEALPRSASSHNYVPR